MIKIYRNNIKIPNKCHKITYKYKIHNNFNIKLSKNVKKILKKISVQFVFRKEKILKQIKAIIKRYNYFVNIPIIYNVYKNGF